jgi:hypothetical protein
VPHTTEWLDWLSRVVGTRMWVVAPRLTGRMRDKGYDFCITPRTYKALETGYAAQADSEFGPWHPASGYRTERGRNMWRVTRERKDNHARFEQLTGPGGNLVLLGTYEAARRRAVAENGA